MEQRMIKDFQRCCREVIAASIKHPNNNGLAIAATYARSGIWMEEKTEIECQSLYILSNLQHWRGPDAFATKETLKRIGK